MEREILRYRVALQFGLTEKQARRLIGDTAEELVADAERMLKEPEPMSRDLARKVALKRTKAEEDLPIRRLHTCSVGRDQNTGDRLLRWLEKKLGGFAQASAPMVPLIGPRHLLSFFVLSRTLDWTSVDSAEQVIHLARSVMTMV